MVRNHSFMKNKVKGKQVIWRKIHASLPTSFALCVLHQGLHNVPVPFMYVAVCVRHKDSSLIQQFIIFI